MLRAMPMAAEWSPRFHVPTWLEPLLLVKGDHPLSGLMSFIAKGEWREKFGQLLGEHLSHTLDAFGLTTETLIQLLGKDRSAKLWGCILEDLMSRNQGPEPRNVVDDYLRGVNRAEHKHNRAYMLAVRRSVMSLYEVVDIAPDQGFVIRDAIRDLKPVTVDNEAWTSRVVGDWVAARIILENNQHSVTGGSLFLTAPSAESLLAEIRSIGKGLMLRKLKALDDRQLRLCTPVFTQAWLLENLPSSLRTN